MSNQEYESCSQIAILGIVGLLLAINVGLIMLGLNVPIWVSVVGLVITGIVIIFLVVEGMKS